MVDKAAYLVAKNKYETLSADEQIAFDGLTHRDEVEQELNELVQEGILDSPAQMHATRVDNKHVIKSLCLNICHDCNLRCKYCFADEGKYHGGRSKMTVETACKALDFLMRSSGTRKHLEVDFFGGEPMMNFDVVRATVAYGRKIEKEFNKQINFTMTTNAVSMSDDDMRFINENMKNVVLSIDGRKEVHDRVRPNAGGQGSFDAALRNALKFREMRGDKEYYIRGTYTALNTDFSQDALAIADYGFDQLSLEPVVLPQEHYLALHDNDLPALKEEYNKLAVAYYERLGTKRGFNFFHFNIDLNGGPCEQKRLTGCGAGVEYVAIAVNGDIYPCHQFVGDPEYLMGNIDDGITDQTISETFCGVNINTKPDCIKCWARYYCSGGCNANAVHFSKDLYQPMKLMCELSRERTECALALKALQTQK